MASIAPLPLHHCMWTIIIYLTSFPGGYYDLKRKLCFIHGPCTLNITTITLLHNPVLIVITFNCISFSFVKNIVLGIVKCSGSQLTLRVIYNDYYYYLIYRPIFLLS